MEIKAAVKGDRILGLNTQAKPPFDTSLPLNAVMQHLLHFQDITENSSLGKSRGTTDLHCISIVCSVQYPNTVIHRLKSKMSTAQTWETHLFSHATEQC